MVLLLIGLTLLVGIGVDRHHVVDTAWGLQFAAIAIYSLIASRGHGDLARRWLLVVTATVWGLRLAVHLARRGRGQGEDPRYEPLLQTGFAHRALNAAVKIMCPKRPWSSRSLAGLQPGGALIVPGRSTAAAVPGRPRRGP